MKLEDLAKEFEFNCQCRRLSAKTTENYRKQIEYLLTYLKKEYEVTDLHAVTPQQIRHFLMDKQREGRKPNYINDLLKAFKCMFKYAYQEGYTESILTERVQNVRTPKVIINTFNEKEIRNMVQYWSGADFVSVRNKLILAMLFDTGIRLSELTGMKIDQIHSDYILIHGKGDKERVVGKTPYIAKLLLRYLRVREGYCVDCNAPSEVFLSRYRQPLSRSSIENLVKETGLAVGVRAEVRLSPHTCRHTFAQMQLRNGLDLYSLSRVMGHEHIYTTQQYLEGLKDREILQASRKTSPLMNL